STTDSITATFAGGNGQCMYNVRVLEFSGIAGTNPFGGSSSGGVTTSTSASSGSITLTNTEAVVGAVCWNNTTGTINGETGWNPVVDAVSSITGVTEYIITSASPQAATSTDSTSSAWAGGAVAYLPGAPLATFTPTLTPTVTPTATPT